MRVVTIAFTATTQHTLVVGEDSVLRSAALMSGSDCLITTNPQLTSLSSLADGTAEFPVIQLGQGPTDNQTERENLNIAFPIGETIYINATNPQTFVSLIFEAPTAVFGL